MVGIIVGIIVDVAGVVTVGMGVETGAIVVVAVDVIVGKLVGFGIVVVCDGAPVPDAVAELIVGLALTVSSVLDGESASWEHAVASTRRRLLQSPPFQRVRVDGLAKWRAVVMGSSQAKRLVRAPQTLGGRETCRLS